MSGWIDEWVNGQTDGWIDGWLYSVCIEAVIKQPNKALYKLFKQMFLCVCVCEKGWLINDSSGFYHKDLLF